MRKLLFITICLTFLINTYANDIFVPFGSENSEIGILQTQSDFWYPHFFDIDSENNIYIPDFYKNRIAVFDEDGNFQDEIKTTSGIQPNMNYFKFVDKQYFITYCNSTLWVIDSKGILLYKYQFGIGSFPDNIICTKRYIFLYMNSFSNFRRKNYCI